MTTKNRLTFDFVYCDIFKPDRGVDKKKKIRFVVGKKYDALLSTKLTRVINAHKRRRRIVPPLSIEALKKLKKGNKVNRDKYCNRIQMLLKHNSTRNYQYIAL